jgi:hypothetical protein
MRSGGSVHRFRWSEGFSPWFWYARHHGTADTAHRDVYGVITAMANLLDEDDFTLVFQKGNALSIHFEMITSEYLLIAYSGDSVQ